MICARRIATLTALLAHLLPAVASAQSNLDFQIFFEDACINGGAVLDLNNRCADIEANATAPGALSGPSEVSMTPSQGLAMNQSAMSRALATVKETQERLEIRREGIDTAWNSEPVSSLGDVSRLGVFLNGRWEHLDRDSTSSEKGWEGDEGGVQFGADYLLSGAAFVGAIVTLDWADFDFDGDPSDGMFSAPGNAGNSESDSYGLTLFGSYNFSEEFWADLHVGGGYSDYSFQRRASLQDDLRVQQTTFTATSDSKGGEFETGIGVGYDESWGGFSGGGYARVNYVWTTVEGYQESDSSGLQMRVNGLNQESVVSVLGIRGDYAISTPIGVLVPQARVEYEHEFMRDRQTLSARFVQDTADNVFRTRGDSPDRNYGNAGVSISLVMEGGWTPFVDYEALFEHSFYERHRLTFGIRKEL